MNNYRAQTLWMWIILGCLSGAFANADKNSDREEQLPLLMNMHAHNDYTHHRPLFDALDHGFASVEADIRLNGDV